MKPEELLHFFGPYLPTDRFRALLRQSELLHTCEGAALLVDVVGFTPMTTHLVSEYGPERACDELKRRLNPMFEAIAGQVFHHGGTVISFTGDGFIAWFDNHPIGQLLDGSNGVPALLRAVSAGLEMQSVMPLFRGLQLRVCIGAGTAHRWVVGRDSYGLADVLSGPAVEAMNSLAGETQSGQVLVHCDAIPMLRAENVAIELTETGNALAISIPDTISRSARRHRWPAWAVEGDVNTVLDAVRPFVGAVVRERVESGFGDFVAELRTALPMFIRIGGAQSENLVSQSVLDTYVRSVQNVMAITGGRLVSVQVNEKGSVLFAVFGAPITHGDDAERAVHAALMLRDLAANNGEIAAQHIGISRGMLYAGTIGGEVRREYSTIGDETNIAARLMSAAGPGQILVSSSARELVGPRIVFDELLPVTVKGKARPIPVAQPVAINARSQGQTHEGRLVGRQAELVQLRQALNAAREGRPRVVRIEGSAGIGKSRLIAELASAAASENFRVAAGNSLSTGRSTPYLPWRSVIGGLLGLPTEASQDDSIALLGRLLSDMPPSYPARQPLLGELLGLAIPDTTATAKLEGRTRHQALFALVTDLVYELARQRPVLIVLEDIHWIDEVSDALLVDLAQRLSIDPAPVMVLISHQPVADVSQQSLQILPDLVLHTRLLMEELPSVDVQAMLEAYLGARIPPELLAFVYERANGNPFFVREVIDTLRENGHIRVIGSMVFIDQDLQSANLPRTVQGIVLARVDSLGEMNKLVLKVAAVIGREFSAQVLAASLPVPMKQDELWSRLRALEDADLIRTVSTDADLVCLFTHSIVQEVTYQSLLHAQRQQLHFAVATALEAMHSDTIERLAYHFSRSGSGKRAGRYLELAGQKAARGYANQAALSYFTQALNVASTSEEKFEINRQRLQVMLRLGDFQGVQAELPEMEQRAIHHDRADWHAMVHILWASLYAQTSAWSGVIAEAQEAVRLALDLGDDTLAWDAYRLLHMALMGINQPHEGAYISDIMVPLTLRLDDQRHTIEFALMQIEVLSHNAPQRALREALDVLDSTRELGDPVAETACWSALIRLYERTSDYAAALDALQQQLQLLRQLGDRRREGQALNQMGIIMVHLGQFSAANKYLLDGYKILHQIEERAGEATSYTYLGVLAYHHKAYGEALAYLNRGLVIQRDLRLTVDMARTLFHMGNVHLASNELDLATQAFLEARQCVDAVGQEVRIYEMDTALAEVDARRGDLDTTVQAIGAMTWLLIDGRGNVERADLFAPGLAFYRVTFLLENVGETEQAELIKSAFRAEAAAVWSRLADPHWRESYQSAIWYHAALLAD